jgi:hypothetical protein
LAKQPRNGGQRLQGCTTGFAGCLRPVTDGVLNLIGNDRVGKRITQFHSEFSAEVVGEGPVSRLPDLPHLC